MDFTKHSYTQLYRPIQGYTQLYRAIHSYTGLYRPVQSYTQLYRAIHSYTGLYRAIHSYPGLHRAIYHCTLLYRPIHGYTELCRVIHSYTGPYIAIQNYTGLCTVKHNHTEGGKGGGGGHDPVSRANFNKIHASTYSFNKISRITKFNINEHQSKLLPYPLLLNQLLSEKPQENEIFHESRIPHEINHASHAFRYSRITFLFK